MIACNCLALCRPSGLWENDPNGVGLWPAATHVKSCHLHIKERFVVLTYNRASVTVTPAEAEEMQRDDGCEYTAQDVWLTRDQFDALPEFEGF